MITRDIDNVQPLAVCLHASACSRRQWAPLQPMLERHVRTVTPDLVGYGDAAPFVRGGRFRLEQEVATVLEQIAAETGKRNGPLHLIGHSYGGAVALQLALMHPERVASLTLYEPAQFMMLFEDGLKSAEAREIRRLRNRVIVRSRSPFRRWRAARVFVQYWSGEGAWDRLTFGQRRRLSRTVPKIIAEFDAVLSSGVAAADFAGLDIPVRLICGSRTRKTARQICAQLARALPRAELVHVEGAGHMAPCTDPGRINPLIAAHVVDTIRDRYRIAA